MAELAFGAVNSLLGLLRDEAQLLDRVRNDVQFIREEMESMNSFLRHLSQTTPASGEHEEPVRTWMKQVRDLAIDCSNCIDLYVRRGGGAAVRADDAKGLLGYLRWVQWSVRALLAHHQSAAQIRELKFRAHDVGQRRMRYGVELPKADGKQQLRSMAGASSSSTQSAVDGAAGGHESGTTLVIEDAGEVVNDDFIKGVVLGFPKAHILEECTKELIRCLSNKDNTQATQEEKKPPLKKVIVIAAPGREDGRDVSRKAYDSPTVEELFEQKLRFSVERYCITWSMLLQLRKYMLEMVKGTAGAAAAAVKAAKEGTASALLEEGSTVAAAAKSVPPEEDAWDAFRDILDILIPTEDNEERADRDGWKEDQIADKIREKLGLEGKRSLIVIDDFNHPDAWPWMEKVLSTLGCAEGSAVVVTTSVDSFQASPITPIYRNIITLSYSLVDFFCKKATTVIDRNYENAANGYLRDNLRTILGEIQEKCEPKEFCMRMFIHYVFANPNRTKEEMDKLLKEVLLPLNYALDNTDVVKVMEINGRRLLRFCYSDLPRTYRTCLAYLAIFPAREKIRRSRLVGRWIVEGLITERDMRGAVREAEKCFDALVNRWFVCPGDIGDARKVKSCTVEHELVQELIADIGRKEGFLDPRLSGHLAQHFSVHNDLKLRRLDKIADFMESLGKKKSRNSKSHSSASELKLLKVLDLQAQGSSDLEPNNIGPKDFNRYLKNICSNILFLKYLNLRSTKVTKLPKEINKLMQLEILDIRQTSLPSSATKEIMLPKLKCLLAGCTIRAEETFSSVQIPRKIKDMANLEVLSHVKASQEATELEDIGQLWQLWKLGVDIDANEDHLNKLLRVISNLNECLKSLSIWIKSNTEVPHDASSLIPPKLLESLSIRGRTTGKLLPTFLKDCHQLIAKVTLHSTMLRQDKLKASLRQKRNLRCLRLQQDSYDGKELTFNENEFPTLKFLVVECSKITSISFRGGAPNLQKIVWSFTNIESLSGISNLLYLQELELNGDRVPDKVRKDIEAHRCHPVLKHSPSQHEGQRTTSG